MNTKQTQLKQEALSVVELAFERLEDRNYSYFTCCLLTHTSNGPIGYFLRRFYETHVFGMEYVDGSVVSEAVKDDDGEPLAHCPKETRQLLLTWLWLLINRMNGNQIEKHFNYISNPIPNEPN